MQVQQRRRDYAKSGVATKGETAETSHAQTTAVEDDVPKDKSVNDDQDTVEESVGDETSGADETDECMQNTPNSTSSVADIGNILDNVDEERSSLMETEEPLFKVPQKRKRYGANRKAKKVCSHCSKNSGITLPKCMQLPADGATDSSTLSASSTLQTLGASWCVYVSIGLGLGF